MICPNCGGEYKSTKQFCPYCKSENKKVAEKIKSSTLNEMDRKYRDEEKFLEKELPKRVVSKSVRYTVIVICGLIGLAVLIFLLVTAADARQRKSELQDKEAAVQKLEQYFQEGDYAKMAKCLERAGYVTFMKKYQETAEIYGYYNDWVLPQSQEWQDLLKENPTWEELESSEYILKYLIEYANEILFECEEWCNDTAFLGNEKVLADFAEETEKLLRETYFMTDEQIEAFKQKSFTFEEISTVTEEMLKPYSDRR